MATVTKAKNQKQKSKPKEPKETGSREKAILQALEERPEDLTVEEIGARAREILSIKRKAWGHAVWELKHDGKIERNSETKKYLKV